MDNEIAVRNTAPGVTFSEDQFLALLNRISPPAQAPHDVSIADASAAWETWAAAHLRKSTRDAYRLHFTKLIEHAGVTTLGALTRRHIEAWKLHLIEKWTPRSANNASRMARHVYHWMTEFYELDFDPFHRVHTFKQPRKWYRFLTAEEIDRLLDCATECRGRRETEGMRGWNCWASIMLAAYAGLRKGEVVHCRWEWFDWDAGTTGMLQVRPVTINGVCVWEPKSAASAGDVPIHPKLRQAFYIRRRERGWVIAPEKDITSDYRWRYDGKRAFARACKKAGLEWVTMHTLRHSVASLMAEQGFTPIDISLMLRHQDTRCVSIYAHPRSEKLDISRLKL